MTHMTITADLDREALLDLRAQIDVALSQTAGDDRWPARAVWQRVGRRSRRFLVACAQTQLEVPESEFTLEDVNQHLGWEYRLVRQRKMTLGRTERKAGVSLFTQQLKDGKTHYRMDRDIAEAILELNDGL